MNSAQSEPKSNIFCLTGILAALLLIFGIVGEGHADTLSRNTGPHTIHVSSMGEDMSETWTVKSLKGKKVGTATINLHHEVASAVDIGKADEQPKKKRMGLALMFLGILAEEG